MFSKYLGFWNMKVVMNIELHIRFDASLPGSDLYHFTYLHMLLQWCCQKIFWHIDIYDTLERR